MLHAAPLTNAQHAPCAQGDAEAALNLPVSQGFSREGHSRPHSQIGFIKFMVRPLYASLADLAPSELKPMQDNLGELEDFCA